MKKKVSLFLIVFLAVTAILLTVYIVYQNNAVDDSSANVASPVMTGFNTQLRLDGTSNLNLENFKKSVDKISEQGFVDPVIRISIDTNNIFTRTDIASSKIDCTSGTPVNCNPGKITEYKNALAYAKTKKLKVLLVTSVPYMARVYSEVPDNEKGWSVKYSQRDYVEITKSVYTILAKELGAYVDIWNIFNEANNYAFDSHLPIESSDYSNYLRTIRDIFKTANTSILENDKTGPRITTTDIAGILSSTDINYTNWKKFIDEVGRYINVLSFNTYPEFTQDSIQKISNEITNLTSIYKKPIYITEVGVCRDHSLNSIERTDHLVSAVRSFMGKGVKGVLVYQLQDDDRSWQDECGKSFGLFDQNWNQNVEFNSITSAMKERFNTTQLIDNSASCEIGMNDDFGYDGEIDWAKWAAARVLNYENGALKLNNGDWIQSAYRYENNAVTTIDLSAFMSIPNTSWLNIEFASLDSTIKIPITIFKETNGSNLNYRIRIQKDNQDRYLELGSDIMSVNPIVIWRQNNNIFFGGKLAEKSKLLNFYIPNIPKTTYKVGLSVNDSIRDNSSINTTVALNEFEVKNCASENRKVVCGPMDVDDNNILDYKDITELASIIGKQCSDMYSPAQKCGGKDSNLDGFIDFKDFESFQSRFGMRDCKLDVPTVSCGLMDSDKDNLLTITDFSALSINYGKRCSNYISPTTGCGGQDANLNGFIDESDLNSLRSRFGLEDCRLAVTAISCTPMDINGDLAIDISDWNNMAESLGHTCSSYTQSNQCGNVDSNNDGKVDEIDFEKYKQMFGKEICTET